MNDCVTLQNVDSEPSRSTALPRTAVLAALGPVVLLLAFLGMQDDNLEIDLAIECEVGEWKNVYEFAPSDTSANGWDYVYTNPDTGERIEPGDTEHPSDPGLTDLELVVVERVQETGVCTATSAAAEQHDGDITFTMGSVWEEHSVPFSQLTPYSDHHWKGTQPGFIDVAVTVNDTTVSERRDIYFSGCT